MFFQNQSSQKTAENRADSELGRVQSGLIPSAKEREEVQIPRLYQKEDIITQSAQTITAISQNTVFCGNIDTKDNVAVFGRLEGNILHGASIRVSGTVKGDIHGEAFQASDGAVEGNVWASGEAELSEKSRIIGNLQCDYATISGTVTGDVTATHGVTLSQTAVINGNLQTSEIEIQKGAKFNGMFEVGKPAPNAPPTPTPAKPLITSSTNESFPVPATEA